MSTQPEAKKDEDMMNRDLTQEGADDLHMKTTDERAGRKSPFRSTVRHPMTPPNQVPSDEAVLGVSQFASDAIKPFTRGTGTCTASSDIDNMINGFDQKF